MVTQGTNVAPGGRRGARARAGPRCPRQPRPPPVFSAGPRPAGTPRPPGWPPSWPRLDPSRRKTPGGSGASGGRPFPTPPLRGTRGQPGRGEGSGCAGPSVPAGSPSPSSLSSLFPRCPGSVGASLFSWGEDSPPLRRHHLIPALQKCVEWEKFTFGVNLQIKETAGGREGFPLP